MNCRLTSVLLIVRNNNGCPWLCCYFLISANVILLYSFTIINLTLYICWYMMKSLSQATLLSFSILHIWRLILNSYEWIDDSSSIFLYVVILFIFNNNSRLFLLFIHSFPLSLFFSTSLFLCYYSLHVHLCCLESLIESLVSESVLLNCYICVNLPMHTTWFPSVWEEWLWHWIRSRWFLLLSLTPEC